MKKNTPPVAGQSYLIVMRKFRLSEVVLAVIYFLLLFFLLPLQYDNIRVRTFLYPVIWISVLFVAYKAFFERSKERYEIGKLGGILTFVFLIFYIPCQFGLCAWSSPETLYVNRKDQSVRLISRNYSCYMTDSDFQLFEERSLTGHFSWVTEYNETPVDTVKWMKAKN